MEVKIGIQNSQYILWKIERNGNAHKLNFLYFFNIYKYGFFIFKTNNDSM